MEHLLVTLPFPEPKVVIDRIQNAFPNLKITYVRHNVPVREAFVRQEMDVPTEILHEITVLMTMGFVPKPIDVPRLRLIHFNVAGLDHVEGKLSLQDSNVSITSSVGGPSPAVAEWVIGALLGQFRQLFTFKELQRTRTWRSVDISNPPSNLYGKTMAILGYGSIGRQVARVAQALGMKIIVCTSRLRSTAASRKEETYHQAGMGDPDGTLPSAWYSGRTKEELHAFLSCGADVLVLSLPLTAETRHIIGQEELRIMNDKNPVFLVNIARGSVIDHLALLQSLKDGPKNGGLLGAALDVTEPEPLPADSELWTLPNVFISPHVSAVTPGTIDQSYRILEENLARREVGKELINVIKIRNNITGDIEPQYQNQKGKLL